MRSQYITEHSLLLSQGQDKSWYLDTERKALFLVAQGTQVEQQAAMPLDELTLFADLLRAYPDEITLPEQHIQLVDSCNARLKAFNIQIVSTTQNAQTVYHLAPHVNGTHEPSQRGPHPLVYTRFDWRGMYTIPPFLL